MEKTTRRIFCGTAMMAFPMLALAAQGKDKHGTVDDLSGSEDPLLDALADEFTRVTADGAQNGFKTEHFRHYAEFVRIFDAHLEGRGTNKEIDRRLDEDDFNKLDPARAARNTANYWHKHGIDFREDELAAGLTMDANTYREVKKAIKKQGGVRALHARIADALERKAKEHETAVLRGGPSVQEGRISFPKRKSPLQLQFINVQYELLYALGWNFNCLCRAMQLEGGVLMLLCDTLICLPCCAPGAILLALLNILQGLGLCNPNRC
jgi:hypothetical protein